MGAAMGARGLMQTLETPIIIVRLPLHQNELASSGDHHFESRIELEEMLTARHLTTTINLIWQGCAPHNKPSFVPLPGWWEELPIFGDTPAGNTQFPFGVALAT